MDLKDLLLWSLVPEPDFSFFKESRERYKSFCETNSTFITKDFCNYDHKDEMIFKTETYIKMLQEFIKNKEPLKIYNKEAFYGFVGQYFLSVNAFLSTIQMLGDSNQVQYWTDLVMNGRIIGNLSHII